MRVRVANIGATQSPDVDAGPLRGPLLPFAAEVPIGRAARPSRAHEECRIRCGTKKGIRFG